MKAFRLSLLFSISIILICSPIQAQKKQYVDQCKIAFDLIDSANRTFYNFFRLTTDTTITIFDIHNVLTDCLIDSIGAFRIIIINSGKEVELIKEKGIFHASKNRRDVFVFTKEHLENLTGFRLYHPNGNGSCYWAFIKKKHRYHFKEKSYGWF